MTARVRPNQILLLKMTPGERGESSALSPRSDRGIETIGARSDERRAARRDVLLIRPARTGDVVRLGRHDYDLASSTDRAAFAAAIGLAPAPAAALARVLGAAAADTRDELAQLARVLGWAERGRLDLRRVALSGHYAPEGIRGNTAAAGDPRPHNGVLSIRALARVVRLFPAAAARVEHLMIASCFAGGSALAATSPLATYRAIFPNLASVTAYGGRAPRSGGGAERDLGGWARATRNGDAPARDQIFGRCREPHTRAQQRRARGVVFTAGGATRCR